ncbi:uncharacterized protein TNCV_3092511 [Trichonephila clavipes]|uniref:Uncharacterized protein n=1 Tax=Trichonephila clavipes TaxID=2585209 RepID=A0A8X6S340_TRICX|nr:uncharacterized protein TNCV_3092511 [Trichonephila clavipes]
MIDVSCKQSSSLNKQCDADSKANSFINRTKGLKPNNPKWALCGWCNNARDPTARLMEDFFEAETMQRIELPACSSDLTLSRILGTHSKDVFNGSTAFNYYPGRRNLPIVACLVTSSSPVPLKTRRVGQRCTLNLSKAETSFRWCGVVVRRGRCQLRCRPRHLTMVQNYVVRRQKPSCS